MSFKLFSKVALCLLVSTFFFTACEKDDDNNNDNCSTAGTMTYKLDGRLVTATSFNNTLIKSTDNSFGVPKDAKRFDIRGTAANGEQLIISISEFRDGKVGDGIRLDKYYLFYESFNNGYCEEDNGVTFCNGALGTYFPTSDLSNFYMTTEGDESDTSQYIIITANDASNHTISGRFKFTIDDAFSGTAQEVTEGEFTNLCYIVLQ